MKWILLSTYMVFCTACQTTLVQNQSHRSLSSEYQEATFDRDRPLFLPGVSRPFKKRDSSQSSNHGQGQNQAMAPLNPGGIANQLAKKSQAIFFENMDNSIFQQAATFSEGLIKGAVVKFLIDRRKVPYKIYFLNGNYTNEDGVIPDFVKFHFYFAQNQLGVKLDSQEFNAATYFTDDPQKKLFVAGTLQKYDISKEEKKMNFFGIQFYPQDYISDKTILGVAKAVKSSINFPSSEIKVVSAGSQQNFVTHANELNNFGVGVTSIEEVYSGVEYISMHEGTTYGVLRYKPLKKDFNALLPTDIPVFDELPLDLSVVAGVVTSIIQDAGSHINLKSKERNTPNAVVRSLEQLKMLELFNNKPVKLTVDDEFFKIEPSTQASVKKFYEDKLKSKVWKKIDNGPLKDMASFDSLAAQKIPLILAKTSTSYGGKASKLAFLAHKDIAGMNGKLFKELQFRLTPIGFGIPVSWYIEFVDANLSLKLALEKFNNAEMGVKKVKPLDTQVRIQKLLEIQKMFLTAPMPEKMVKAIAAQIEKMKEENALYYPKSPFKKVKIRSSANAEDIPNFDGAGLHSSYSAEMKTLGIANEPCEVVQKNGSGVETKEEISPESFVCGIKGVFASLWNKRAVDERSFARIDQTSVAMGIAVNSSYNFRRDTESIKEIANAVVVTRVINSKGVYGYRISTNTDDNLVTNPTPGTQAEVMLASFLTKDEKPQFSFLQYAKLAAGDSAQTKPILSEQVYSAMVKIAKEIEDAYCRKIPTYYPGGDCYRIYSDVEKPNSLDMEFKIYDNGQVLLKQIREFSGQ